MLLPIRHPKHAAAQIPHFDKVGVSDCVVAHGMHKVVFVRVVGADFVGRGADNGAVTRVQDGHAVGGHLAGEDDVVVEFVEGGDFCEEGAGDVGEGVEVEAVDCGENYIGEYEGNEEGKDVVGEKGAGCGIGEVGIAGGEAVGELGEEPG